MRCEFLPRRCQSRGNNFIIGGNEERGDIPKAKSILLKKLTGKVDPQLARGMILGIVDKPENFRRTPDDSDHESDENSPVCEFLIGDPRGHSVDFLV
jgi:hypothetical protein